MARGVALAAALAAALLAVSGAGGGTEQTPKRGGTLVIAWARHLEPACLNPFVEACNPSSLDRVLVGAYEVTPDGGFRPDLATAEIVRSDPFTLRYRIRPDARWSDGTPITARDFEFTHEAALRVPPDSVVNHFFWAHDHQLRIRSVRAVDAKTAIVVLKARYVDWGNFFAVVLPRHVLAGQDLAQVWHEAIDNPKTGAPIASGPFLVERFERGRQLVLRRNSRYWGEHNAYLNGIVLRYTAPGDAASALRDGQVDMIDPGPGVLQASAVEFRRRPAPGIRVQTGDSSSWEHLDFRQDVGGNPALENKLVRQALAYGIDRVAIARAVLRLLGETGTRAVPYDSVVFVGNSRYYRPSWKRYRYRPAKAQQLLEQAGCQRGADRIYVCGGVRLSLRLGTAGGVERRKLTLELAQEQLRTVGVATTLDFHPPSRWVDVLEQGTFDVFQFSWIGGASTSGPVDIFGCQAKSNFTGYCDRLVTRDLNRATKILDESRRIALLNRIDARLAEAVPALPLFQNSYAFAFDVNVRGVVDNPFGRFTWNAEDWWLDD